MSYIRFAQVTKKFGDVTAVDGLDLEINKGECFSILGPSGCGKTTLLRMLAGFDDLDCGEIHMGENLLSSKPKGYYLPPEKRGFGMVFQSFAVWPHINVYENVAFPLRLKKLHGAEIDKRVKTALEQVNLPDAPEKNPAELSGGGRQRVALARALAINPDVLLLDEPLSNLDPLLREQMRFEIKALQKMYGFTVVYVTHDQAEAMALSDRILVMKNGVVQQCDTPIKVYTEPVNRFVYGFIGTSNFIEARVTDNGIKVGDSDALQFSRMPPQELSTQGMLVLASRPSEIGFVSENGVPGTVKRKAFWGEIVDYVIDVAQTEISVQIGRRTSGPDENEACCLNFMRPSWFST